jgi:hypothetical protein
VRRATALPCRSLAEESAVYRVSASLSGQDGACADAAAVDALANGKRYLIGVGTGKLVAAGTDVGLSASAQRCLDVLLDRAAEHAAQPSLNLVQIKRTIDAREFVRRALLLAEDGDILFFFVDDSDGCRAVVQAVNTWTTATWKAVRVAL